MNKLRDRAVIIIAIDSIIVTVISFINPAVKSSEVANFNFPASVTLAQSKLLYSGSINTYLVQPPAYTAGKFIAGKHYRYLYNLKYLDIEMRYLTNTNGDLKSFITSQTGELYPVLKQNTNGFYSIYNDESKAYTDACINSRGGSTVTNDRFNRDRLIYDLRLKRILPWLLGRSELKDRRCLWTHISIALDNNTSIAKTYKDLETVWFNWHEEWQSNFPN